MKRYLATFFLPIGVLLIATAQPTFANLIVNGDFQNGNLSGWTTTPAATGSNFGVAGIPPAHDTLGVYFAVDGPILTRLAKPLSLRRGLRII